MKTTFNIQFENQIFGQLLQPFEQHLQNFDSSHRFIGAIIDVLAKIILNWESNSRAYSNTEWNRAY